MSYSVREVAAMLGLTPSQVRAFAAKGVVDPERGNRGELRFGFRDLIILRTAGERVVVRDGGGMWNPESGQSLFDFSVAEMVAPVGDIGDFGGNEQERDAD